MAVTPGQHGSDAQTPRAPWTPGARLGRYTLVAPLAHGGMAEVWIARQSGVKGFEKVVVVKRMLHSYESAEHVEMFLAEARLAAQLNHHNLVQIFELGEEEGDYFIAMEYLDGENLSTVRRAATRLKRPMSNALYARMVAGAAEGLHYAHERGIVHRDVSPQNIIVTYDGGVKVVDFGIAKVASHATVSGGLKGKLAYMAPEQARGEATDARSDVFALGIVLFELTTGTRLLPDLNDLEILNFMASDRRFPEPLERADVPRQLERIIMKAMARRPADRYATARDLQSALEDDFIRTSAESASSADIAACMRGLFAERIHERRAMVETAMDAGLTPGAAARSIQGLRKVDLASASQVRPAPTRRLVGGLLVATALLGGGAALWATTRQPAPSVVLIDTSPAGARVTLDARDVGDAPTVVEVSPGRHRVTAALERFEATTRDVELGEGEKLRLVLTLAPELTPAAAPETPAETPAEPAPAPVEAAPVEPAADVRPGPGDKGKLSLNTDPWTTVYLGKTELGNTPLLGVPLPAGKHVLRLVNPEFGVSRTLQVEISAGKTTVRKLKLDPAPRK